MTQSNMPGLASVRLIIYLSHDRSCGKRLAPVLWNFESRFLLSALPSCDFCDVKKGNFSQWVRRF